MLPDTVFLSTKKAAEFLGLAPRTLSNWRSKPPTNFDPPRYYQAVQKWRGSVVTYALEDLIAWKASTLRLPSPRSTQNRVRTANA